MEPSSATDAADWLDTLQQLADAVAHELRNALNGVAVNVEVMRSRSQREGVEASSLATFATHAAEQVESAVALSEALLRVARPARIPLDVAALVADLRQLLGAVAARADGGFEGDVRGLALLQCDANEADRHRATIAKAMLDAAHNGGAALRAEGDAKLVVKRRDGREVVLTFSSSPR